MNTSPEHLSFEVLNDLVDGRLDPPDTSRAQAHLDVCEACAAEHEALRSVMAGALTLPKAVLPPSDIWPDLKKSLDSRKTVVLPGTSVAALTDGRGHERRISWRSGAFLAAAAVILVVLSSGITALVLRRPSEVTLRDSSRVLPQPGPLPDAPGGMLPVIFRQTESEYTRTIDELKLAVDTQRSRLNPETIRTVDHSLAVVDSAIAEARAALTADPNNRMLVDLLSASYQRKLDLLRRTSELGSRI